MDRIESIVRELRKTYGINKPEKSDPLDTLIFTILSQNTTDTNSSRAYENLIKHFKIKDLPLVNTNKLAKVIHSGGLPMIKAKRIKNAVRVWQKEGLGRKIRKMSDDEVRETLTKIHGVGPKTAEVVLMFGLGRPALPVDTHVYRVSRRLGLVPEKASREKAAEILRQVVPRKMWTDFHLGLISHGRTVCKAQNPRCLECMLLDYCPYGKRVVKIRTQ